MILITDKFKKDYDKYLDEFETSDWMDVDSHTRWSLSVGELIRKIEKLEKEKEEIKVTADLLIFQKNIKIQKLEQENKMYEGAVEEDDKTKDRLCEQLDQKDEEIELTRKMYIEEKELRKSLEDKLLRWENGLNVHERYYGLETKLKQKDEESKRLKEENELLTEHCSLLEQPIVNKVLKTKLK